jgi:hypothetical protein
LLSQGGLNDLLPAASYRLVVAFVVRDRRVSQSQRATGFRPQVWTSLLGLPRSMADAELLRAEVQRQRLPAYERSGFSNLAESIVLAGHVPHHAVLAP